MQEETTEFASHNYDELLAGLEPLAQMLGISRTGVVAVLFVFTLCVITVILIIMSYKEGFEMGKFEIVVKIWLFAVGIVLFGFGLLCYITTYIAGSYDATTGVATGIGAEFQAWGLGFMLDIFVQAFVMAGGLLIAFMCLYSLYQAYANRCR